MGTEHKRRGRDPGGDPAGGPMTDNSRIVERTAMSGTDRPDDETLELPKDPSAEDTGLWPSPVTEDQPPDVPPEDTAVTSEADHRDESPRPDPDAIAPEQKTRRPVYSPWSPSEPGSVPVPAPAPVADEGAQLLDAIGALESRLDQRLSGLQALFDREVRAEATRERIVDRLHAELQDYKQDLLLKVQRPIFVDLIQLHDDIGKMIEAQPQDDPDRAAAVRGTLESIRTAIEDILYRQGVEPFHAEGEEFDPRRQRAVTTVPTEESERNKTIAGRLRPGFQAGEKLIRPEIVSVFTLRK
jgi:molecular chaperone GrpE